MAIQQMNNGLSSVERRKFSGVDLSPQQSDFKDSTNTYADSDTAIGIMNPRNLDMTTWGGYDIKEMQENFRCLKIIKNRRGKDNVQFGLYFNPRAGFFKQLPHPDEIKKNPFFMEKIRDGSYGILK